MNDDFERTRVGDRIVIYPRGKKKIYVADFWEGNAHRRKSLKTTNKKEAIKRATKLANDLLQGTFHATPVTVEASVAVEQYLTLLRTENRAHKTLVKYKGVLDLFLEFIDRRRVRHLHRVTANHFDQYRAERAETLEPKTVYCEAIIVKQLFKFSKSRKLIAENPLQDIRLNKPRLELQPSPTLDQVNQILNTSSDALRGMLSVLAMTGMRSGELQRLRPEDVDLIGNWIHVCSREGAETKNRLSRKIPIHARLRPILENSLKLDRPWLFTADASPKYPQGDHHINPKKLNDRFLALLKKLKLPTGRKTKGFVIHSLRHFFETFCINSGIPQRVVDVWMGHAPGKSMAAVYYRLDDVESQNFMKRVPFGTGLTAADAGKEIVK